VLAEPQRCCGVADPPGELLLRGEALRLRLQELVGLVVVLEHLELDLRLGGIEAGDDRLLEPSLRVRQVLVGVLGIGEDADMPTAGILSVLLRDRMQVEHRPAGDEKLMDVTQGVHDALAFDSSQGPGEEREVEAPPRDVDVGRTDGCEGNAVREVRWQSRVGAGDLILIGIDGENAPSRIGVAEGQPAVTAAELEHAKTVQRSDLRQCVSLRPFGIDPLRHARIMAGPRRSFCPCA
jgi:hypothetical protein